MRDLAVLCHGDLILPRKYSVWARATLIHNLVQQAALAAPAVRQRRSGSLRSTPGPSRLHTSGPNQRAAESPDITRQASPEFAAMVLHNTKRVRTLSRW